MPSTLLLFAVFRSRRAVGPLTQEDEDKLMRLLLDKCGGRDSPGYSHCAREKNVVWSASQKAAVAGGIPLASGDPIAAVRTSAPRGTRR
ncbi:hypothetical protein [Streptomyces sp. NPDC001774]